MQLPEAVQNRGVRRPNRVKQIAGDDDQIRLLLEDIVHRAPKRFGDVDLALVRPFRRLPVELAKPEMQIGEMGELHQ
jgi:hypothetical protein